MVSWQGPEGHEVNAAVGIGIAVLVGFSALASQASYVRECMVAIGETYLAWGVPNALWLGAVGAGALVRSKGRNGAAGLGVSTTLAALAVARPASWLAQNLIHTGSGLSSDSIAYLVLVFLGGMPAAFFSGRAFSAMAGLAGETGYPARVYLAESAGGAAALALAGLANAALAGPIWIWAPSIALALVACGITVRGGAGTLRWPAISFAVVAAGWLFVPVMDAVMQSRLAAAGDRLLDRVESPHGRIEIFERAHGASRELLMNRIPIYTSAGDAAHNENLVHFACLRDAGIRTVLVVGGGIGGAVREVLKYPVERVDVAELDPRIPVAGAKWFGEWVQNARSDPRVHIHEIDAWRFLHTTDRAYDLVLLDVPTPFDFQLARFFTYEAFRLMARHLTEGGTLAFGLDNSLVRPREEEINRVVIRTARRVFPELRLYVGMQRKPYVQPGRPTEDVWTPASEVWLAGNRARDVSADQFETRRRLAIVAGKTAYFTDSYVRAVERFSDDYLAHRYPSRATDEGSLATLDRPVPVFLRWKIEWSNEPQNVILTPDMIGGEIHEVAVYGPYNRLW